MLTGGSTVQEVAAAIADRIEEKGWFNLDKGITEGPDSCCVVTGMLDVLSPIVKHPYSYSTTAGSFTQEFSKYIEIDSIYLSNWNDSFDSKEPVVEALRAFASEPLTD